MPVLFFVQKFKKIFPIYYEEKSYENKKVTFEKINQGVNVK